MNALTLGQILKNLRETNNMSQEDLSQKIFVTRQTISNWERDRSEPDLQSLQKIAILFNKSVDELLRNVNNSPKVLPLRNATFFLLLIGIIMTPLTLYGVIATGSGLFNFLAVFTFGILIDLVMWLVYSSAIKTGNVSFLAGYDDTLEYNPVYLRLLLDAQRFWFVLSGVISALPFCIWQFINPSFNFALAMVLMIGYVIFVIAGNVFISKRYEGRLLAQENDTSINMTTRLPTWVLLIAMVLMISCATIGVAVFGIVNNTSPALFYAGAITANSIILTICFVLELNRPQFAKKQGVAYKMRTATKVLYLCSVVFDALSIVVLI